MNEFKLYKCELCGTCYTSKTEAKKCEDAHKIPVKIEKCQYLGYKNLQGGHPRQITVVFNDGSVRNYRKD